MAVSPPLGVAAPGGTTPGAGAPGAAAPGIDHRALLALIADGQLHSGEELAGVLGVSRTAVWKAVERLRLRGIEIEAEPRRGYRLPMAVELLAADRIRAGVSAPRRSAVRSLEVAFDVDSTNTRLLAAPAPPRGEADVLLAELQHAGRGRRGRHWLAPFGGGLALSLAWSFSDTGQALPTLSLAVGVAVARALERVGARGIGLKWPNDVWFRERKIGGVLIDLKGEAGGPAQVVIGIGLNVALSAPVRAGLEASGMTPAAVADACVAAPSRNALAGALIDELLVMLGTFEDQGFAAFHAAWSALDVLKDRPAQAHKGEAVHRGIARGIDPHGALVLEQEGRRLEFTSGEVSLRLDGDV